MQKLGQMLLEKSKLSSLLKFVFLQNDRLQGKNIFFALFPHGRAHCFPCGVSPPPSPQPLVDWLVFSHGPLTVPSPSAILVANFPC